MINFHDVTKENIKEHNVNWSKIPDHQHRISLIRDSRSRKTNSLFNHQPDTANFFFFAKDPYESKYQLLINNRESTGLKNLSF